MWLHIALAVSTVLASPSREDQPDFGVSEVIRAGEQGCSLTSSEKESWLELAVQTFDGKPLERTWTLMPVARTRGGLVFGDTGIRIGKTDKAGRSRVRFEPGVEVLIGIDTTERMWGAGALVPRRGACITIRFQEG
jgi:hypothetical protein